MGRRDFARQKIPHGAPECVNDSDITYNNIRGTTIKRVKAKNVIFRFREGESIGGARFATAHGQPHRVLLANVPAYIVENLASPGSRRGHRNLKIK